METLLAKTFQKLSFVALIETLLTHCQTCSFIFLRQYVLISFSTRNKSVHYCFFLFLFSISGLSLCSTLCSDHDMEMFISCLSCRSTAVDVVKRYPVARELSGNCLTVKLLKLQSPKYLHFRQHSMQ